jgi:hypothetical protein
MYTDADALELFDALAPVLEIVLQVNGKRELERVLRLADRERGIGADQLTLQSRPMQPCQGGGRVVRYACGYIPLA